MLGFIFNEYAIGSSVPLSKKRTFRLLKKNAWAGFNETFSLFFIAGFAIFSMFFGSGNLVFPLALGLETGAFFHEGFWGLFLTGIGVPLLGLLSMLAAKGDKNLFFGVIGKTPGLIIMFLMLSIMGPLGVSARCILVAHGGIHLVFPDISLPLFGGIFCAMTGYLCWRPQKVVTLIGQYLTPFLLLSLGVILLMGVIQAPTMKISPLDTSAFKTGFHMGYQTMDLLAAFFFAASTIAFIQKASLTSPHKKSITGVMISASFLGMGLLAAIYYGLVFLGAAYAPFLKGVPKEALLPKVAALIMGEKSCFLMAFVISLATLTTLMILTNLFSDFCYRHLFKNRVPQKAVLVGTLVLSYATSLLGFTKLASWIGLLLAYAYPALIAMAVGWIFQAIGQPCGLRTHKIAPVFFYGSFVVYIVYHGFLG